MKYTMENLMELDIDTLNKLEDKTWKSRNIINSITGNRTDSWNKFDTKDIIKHGMKCGVGIFAAWRISKAIERAFGPKRYPKKNAE